MVKTITGLESTIEACRKMRVGTLASFVILLCLDALYFFDIFLVQFIIFQLSTAKLQKIPSVILSVSVKGIKFIDARSKVRLFYSTFSESVHKAYRQV